MLYDPKWEVKADPKSIESLIAWLENQSADIGYNWHDCEGGCLIGLYGLALGLGDGWHNVHHHFFDNNLLYIASDTPHTFGAALDRARAALSCSPQVTETPDA